MKYIKIFSICVFFNTIFTESYQLNINSLPKLPYKIRSIDKKIWELSKPATLNYIMVPVVGMVDTLWVTRLGNAKDLAGVGCGDQIFSVFFCVMSFLPVILTPEIARLHTEKKTNDISNLVSVSLLLSLISGILITSTVYCNINLITSFFSKNTNDIFFKTISYLKFRTLALPFCLINSVIFSVFRGLMDFKQAIRINIISQLVNIILDPIFMIKYGISGVASASVLSDIVCTIGYVKLLYKNKLIQSKINNFIPIAKKYLNLGFLLQIKYIIINVLYLCINKRLLQIDDTGNQLAAYILLSKFISLTMVIYSGLSSVSSIVIPSEKIYENDVLARKKLLFYTHIVCFIQSILFFNIKFFLNYLSNDTNVVAICKRLIFPATIYQYVNGYQYVMEGILQGYQKFKLSSKINILVNAPLLLMLWKINNPDIIWYLGTLLYGAKIILINKNLDK